jgi:hypothetical protein
MAQYQSIAEIDREYELRMRAAPDEKKLDVELDWERTKSAFYRDDSTRREKVGWVTKALAAFPRARPGEISGDTEEGIMLSAKTSSDAIEALVNDAAARGRKEAEDEAARNGWGPSGAGGSGGSATGGANPGGKTVDQVFAETVQVGWEGLRRDNRPLARLHQTGQLTPVQAEELIDARIGTIAEYVVDHMEEGRGGKKKAKA